MTKITTIYELVIDRLEGLFPTLARIPNPYSIEDNPTSHLTEAWGVKHNGSDRQPFEICRRRVKATFGIVLTKQSLKIDTANDSFDDPTLTLLENAETVQSSFYERDNLGSSDIINVNVTAISPITNVFADKWNFLTTECLVEIDYFEQI